MNEELQRCINIQNELAELISKAILTVENLLFQRNGEGIAELEISFCCTRRKVEFFVPFNSVQNIEYFPSYSWLLKNEKIVTKSNCLKKFFHPNGRFNLSMIVSDNLPICVRSMSFSVYDINRNTIYQQNLKYGFSCVIQSLKNCNRMTQNNQLSQTSYHKLILFRQNLEESKKLKDSCSINRLALQLIEQWYSTNMSKTSVKDIPKDYICPITLEPLHLSADPIIKLYLPMNNNELISFKGPTKETIQVIKNMKWGPSFYYRRCDLQQHFNAQIYPLTNWEPWTPYTEMDSSGRGGKPGHKEFYLKTPHNLLLMIDANYDPEPLLTRSEYTTFIMAPVRHHQRVGGLFSNTLAVGDEHGALPGHTIYLLIPILVP